jgi:hypothetical protein
MRHYCNPEMRKPDELVQAKQWDFERVFSAARTMTKLIRIGEVKRDCWPLWDSMK